MRRASRYSGAWLVFAGGTLGTLFRYLVSEGFGEGSFPLDIFVSNILGAFLLALAVGIITGSGRLTRRKVRFRLFFGTGMMGGFTTYSTFALQTSGMVAAGDWVLAADYGLGTVLAGGAASILGLLAGRWWARASGGSQTKALGDGPEEPS